MNKPIKVRLIGRTIPLDSEIEAVAEDLGHSGYVVNGTNGEAVIATGGRRCYNSFTAEPNPNVTRVREDTGEYVKNIIRMGHGSVLEHVVYNFSIEGITRVGTAELNRHRAGAAISEASMRYIRLDNGIPYWMPASLDHEPVAIDVEAWATGIMNDDMTYDAAKLSMEEKKAVTAQIFRFVFQDAFYNYQALLHLWGEELEGDFGIKKKLTSMFRRIIPMGISTGGVWSFNIRALRHIIAMRGSEHAEEEIQEVARQLYTLMVRYEPNLFADFDPETLQPEYGKV